MKPAKTTIHQLRLRLLLMVTVITALFWWLEAKFPLISSVGLAVVLMTLYMLTLGAVLVVKRRVRQKKPLYWESGLYSLESAQAKELAKQAQVTASAEAGEEQVVMVPVQVRYPLISIIVPAHNEERVIKQLVDNLMQLDYPNYEVLIVDDASSDSTPQQLTKMVNHYKGSPIHLRWHRRLPGGRKGKSAVLNEARQQLSGEWIIVFDADAQVKPTFIRELLDYALESPNVAAVQARKVICNPGASWWSACQAREYLYDSYMQACRDLGRSAVELRGNGLMIRARVLDEVGGWNEHSVTDDLDMSTRLHMAGYDIRFAVDTPVFEEGVVRFSSLLRQRTRWSEGSLVRYLEYGGRLLVSQVASNRVKADMLTYYVNFFFPLLILIDVSLVLVRLLLGQSNPPSYLITLNVAPLLGLVFVPTMYVALRRFERPKRKASLWDALQTSAYIGLVWMPIVFFSMFQLFTRSPKELVWAKTDHSGNHAAL